jgi:hypothetical protein
MKLHEFHARRLESTLGLAEASISRMEKLLTEGGHDGAVRKVEDTLSGEARDAILNQIRALRALLAEMAAALSLHARSMDIRRVLDAELSTLWMMFENCRPSRMKGYGQEFEPQARAALEKYIERMVDLVVALRTKTE